MISLMSFFAAWFSEGNSAGDGLRRLWNSISPEDENHDGPNQSSSGLFKSGAGASSQHTISKARTEQKGQGVEDCWIPAGKVVEIKGYTIQRGLIYVGTDLYAGGYLHAKENCLIDPTLPVNAANPDYDGESMSYWPSYSEIPGRARAAYLEWLSTGSRQPDVYVGYVFLYFYGLERRLIKDKSLSELETIAREVSRLKRLYGHMGSFGGYADGLLEAALLLQKRKDLFRYSPRIVQSYEPRMTTKLALAQAALQQQPITADWMLAWLYEDPNTNLRTPARRVPEETKELFRQRFKSRFPEGFFIKPNKRALTLNYRAASSTFTANFRTDYPDITQLTGPLKQVRPLLTACCDELDAYSRYLNRNKEKEPDRKAWGLLPRELARTRIKKAEDPFLKWLVGSFRKTGFAILKADELAKRWLEPDLDHLTKSGGLKKRDAEGLGSYLGCINVGIEPDVRISGQVFKNGTNVILFSGKTPPRTKLSDAYWKAATVLKLVTAVAHADNEITNVERKNLIEHIKRSQGLVPEESSRLAAHLLFLLSNPSSLRNVQKEVDEHIPKDKRHEVAEFALLTAVADGHFDPAETRILKKVYDILGLDSETIFSDLHALGADKELVRVQNNKAGAPGFLIPKPPETEPVKQERGAVFDLDLDLIKAKMEDTRKASSLLHNVFKQDDNVEAEVEISENEETDTGVFEGLQANLTILLKKLLVKQTWSNETYLNMAQELGLMPEGALETINEWAFDRIGEALIEGGEHIEIYLDIWEEYIHEQSAN